ncbi:MAG: two-component regulator propeller domain-containing protein [Bacteroidia bacterium]
MKSGFLTLAIVIFSFSAVAQVHNFRNYSVEEGLEQSQVLDIMQDRDGYLWFATYGGLNRFNGKEFSSYTVKEGLSGNQVRAVYEDHRGRIWAGTYGGGITILSRGGEFRDTFYTEILNTANKRFPKDFIFDINGDKNHVYIATNGSGLVVYSNDTFKVLDEQQGFPTDRAYTVLPVNENEVWVGTWKGLCKYNPLTGDLVTFTTANGLPDDRVVSLHVDKQNNLWLGTYGGGMAVIDLNDPKDYEFTPLPVNDELPHKSIVSLAEDAEGNIWGGTYGGGAIRIRKSNSIGLPPVVEVFNEKNGLSNNYIWSLHCDSEGSIWLGTNGGGAMKYGTGRFSYTGHDQGLINDKVFAIEADNDHLYVGTLEGITLFKTDGNQLKFVENITDELPAKHVWSILKDSRRRLWIGTGEGLLLKENGHSRILAEEEGISNNVVNKIWEDSDGIIWFATNAGISIFREGQLIDLTKRKEGEGDKEPKELQGLHLSRHQFLDIHIDREDHIWFASNKGLITSPRKAFLQQPDSFIKITEENGLSQNMCFTLAENPEGDLLIGTYGGGINLIPQKEITKLRNGNLPKIRHITTEEGLTDNSVISLIFIEDGKYLIAGTNRGINKITYKSLNTAEPEIKQFGRAEGFIGLECNQNAIYRDSRNNVWIGTIKGLIKYDPSEDRTNLAVPQIKINQVLVHRKPYDIGKQEEFKHGQNHFTFLFDGLSFHIPEKVRFRYKLEGLEEEWSPPVKENFATYPNIPPGNYIFKVKAMNNDGIWNELPEALTFTIHPPFWQTWWFYLLSFLVLVGLISLVFRFRLIKLQRDKRLLEMKVSERTSELQQAYVELKQLQKFKESMMEMVVHDLKNPLNAVLVSARKFPSTKTAEHIYQAGRQMLNLVLNILDVQKFEEAKVQLKQSKVPFQELIQEVMNQVEFLATQKGVMLKFEIMQNTLCNIDHELVGRVLVNLLTNAIKFTATGGTVTIRATLQEEGVYNGFLKTEIIDTGIGIPPDKINLVFQKFGQVHSVNSGEAKSTGIGLTYCKMVVEAHGGKIWVESAEGEGSNFQFVLPAELMDVPAPEAAMLQNRQEKELSEDLQLEEEQHRELQNHLLELGALKVYQTSESVRILESIEEMKIEAINHWLNRLEQSIYNCDQAGYEEILQKLIARIKKTNEV